MDHPEPILSVSFFKTETGREPVREWLKSLPRECRRISRAKLASRMRTSHAALAPLFAEEETPVTLQLLERAALALGRKLRVELV